MEKEKPRYLNFMSELPSEMFPDYFTVEHDIAYAEDVLNALMSCVTHKHKSLEIEDIKIKGHLHGNHKGKYKVSIKSIILSDNYFQY